MAIHYYKPWRTFMIDNREHVREHETFHDEQMLVGSRLRLNNEIIQEILTWFRVSIQMIK